MNGGGGLAEAQAHHRAGRLGEAESLYRQILETDPDQPDALRLLGLLAGQTGNRRAGEKLIRKSILLAPDNADAHIDLGNLLGGLGDGDGAEAAYREALVLDPLHRLAGLNLASALRAGNEFDQSVNILLQLIEKYEDDPDILNGIGLGLLHWGRAAEARDYFGRVIALQPRNADPLNNLGQALRGTGDLAGAIAAYRQAIALRGDFAEAHWNLCVALMLAGDYPAGRAEWAWRGRGSGAGPSPFPQAQWDGAPLPGGRLLIHGEQGIGDQILSAGLIAPAAGGKAELLVECDARLVPLLARSLPACEVVAMADPPPARCLAEDVKRQISMIDLVPLIDPFPGALTARRGYLKPDAELSADFRDWLGALGAGPAIGISWRSANPRTGEGKSLPLDQWGPILAGRDAVFVNLQYGRTVAELGQADGPVETPPGLDLHDNLDGLAALIAALDLVISTSNVTVHFAGALGIDCWLMLNATPLWYWGGSGETAPFYPSVRLFRQQTGGQWGGVVQQVAGALDDYLAEAGNG